MDDEIRFEPKRIPFSEIDRFKSYLASLAEEEVDGSVFTDRYADVTLSLRYLLEVYEAGTQKKIPAAWIPLYNQMKQEESAEYQMYLRLQEKYGNRHRISEITVDKTLVAEEDEEDGKKKRKRAQTSSSREIVKDGKVSKFK